MGTDAKPSVAVRVVRPFASEEEFLKAELETITRAGVVLLGAVAKPPGVILRFELAIENDVPLLRGEGRVIQYKSKVQGDLPGLTLRFTRLDTRSKALVDKIAAIREERARAALATSMSESSKPPAPSFPPPPVEASPVPISVSIQDLQGPASLNMVVAPQVSVPPGSVPPPSSVIELDAADIVEVPSEASPQPSVTAPDTVMNAPPRRASSRPPHSSPSSEFAIPLVRRSVPPPPLPEMDESPIPPAMIPRFEPLPPEASTMPSLSMDGASLTSEPGPAHIASGDEETRPLTFGFPAPAAREIMPTVADASDHARDGLLSKLRDRELRRTDIENILGEGRLLRSAR